MSATPHRTAALQRGDLAFLHPVRAAQVVEPAPAARWTLWLLAAIVAATVGWAAFAQVDMVTRGDARIVPEGREQVIASLEGGLLKQLKVREGDEVAAGQELALLDPTRFEAQQNEGQARRLALRAAEVRLQAEAGGRAPDFPAELRRVAPQAVASEQSAYAARVKVLEDAAGVTRSSRTLIERELSVAEGLSAKGLMSEIEVMHVRRQLNDLNQQLQERHNRFRQEAASELTRVQGELRQLDEQQVARRDVVERTVLRSPVRGIVKTIKTSTIGGVVTPGAPVMDIVPIADRVRFEVRIKPTDIGFVQVGQPVQIKLATYEYAVYGGLQGEVAAISPDALGDPERPALPGAADASWYRAVVYADRSSLQAHGKPLALLPGMTGTAEVNTGQRSVLSYLLRPMLRAREAFRER